jgi:pimeloyl-ACP methyl ester carboxylesterase
MSLGVSLATLFFVGASFAPDQTTVGVLEGAGYRLAMPVKWDGTLVIFLHGYSDKPATFSRSAPVDGLAKQIVQGGAVYVDAGYRSGGWAIAEALEDVERLRRHVAERVGAPKRVLLLGESMGGMIALALLEGQTEKRYHGGLAFCSGTVSAYEYFKRAFDIRILFDALYPGILPPPDDVPSTFQPSEVLVASVVKALQDSPKRLALMRGFTSVSEPVQIAELLIAHTEALGELRVRAGGNPFDNVQADYPAWEVDERPVAVRRVRSDPAAERYLRRFYTPTGRLKVPFLAVNASSDPIVPRWATGAYPSGNEWFSQQYVEANGHCGVTMPQRLAAVKALRTWMDGGQRPAGGKAP